MNKTIINAAIVFIVALFAAQMTRAQGTLYVSSIVSSMGRFAGAGVASNFWVAEQIETGNNSSGYVLDAVQLGIGEIASGSSGFNVSIYSDVNNLPSTDLGILSGPSNPSEGIYTYNASGLTLTPSTEYFVVATATTLVEWVEGTSPSASGGDQWMIGGLNLMSTDQGSDWTSFSSQFDMQMAIYATPVAEPSTWVLCLLGGGFAFYIRARKRFLTQSKLD